MNKTKILDLMNGKIKSITVVANNYPAEGHMEYVFVQQLVHAIIDQGIKVTVVAPQSIIHVLVHRLNVLPKCSQGITENGNVYKIYRPYILSSGNKHYFRRLIDWINRLIIVSSVSKIKNDILYSHFWNCALPIYEYAIKTKKKLFVACGEGDDAIENMIKTISENSKKRLSSAVTGVISVSTENKRKCADFGLSKIEDISVFPNCVNTAIFHKQDVTHIKKQLGINNDDFVIVFVGNFVIRKGPDRIAKAITQLNDSQIKVMFIGDAYPGHAYDFDCPGVIYRGTVDHDLLPKYLNCADVFVLPTLKEGCCNAIVEALAVGLPVISSNGAFNDDILDENNSIRIDPNSVDAIAEAIKRLKEDTDLRKKMVEYTQSRHANYTIEGRARRIIDFMEEQVSKTM